MLSQSKPISPLIREFVSYDPTTGALAWVKHFHQWVVGPITGLNREGYVRFGFQGRTYLGHRVAWFLFFGEQPPPILDHRNGNRADNRIDNLRAATPSQNLQNQRGRGAFPKGVTLHKRTGKFQAQIQGRYLGLYDTADAAHQVARAAAVELYGEFARWQ